MNPTILTRRNRFRKYHWIQDNHRNEFFFTEWVSKYINDHAVDPNSKKSFFENVTEFEMTNATNSSSQKRMSNHLYWTLRLIISPINYSLKREREHNNWETVLARVSGLRDEIWPRVEDSSPPQLEPPPRDLIAHRLLAFFFFLPFFLCCLSTGSISVEQRCNRSYVAADFE